tara:strand:+ start:315 stop:1673 length:1359 start_codon:yes stop_codon:yes gene_type:complete
MPTNDAALTDAERKSAVFSERLICVAVDANNSKFWHGYVLPDGYAAEYGRVGESPATIRRPMDESSARKKVESETRKRLNYKPPKKEPYVRQRTIESTSSVNKFSAGGKVANGQLRNVAVQQIKTSGNPELKKLIEWLADVNIHAITSNTNIQYDTSSGTFSTPLGIVTADGITDARTLLVDIGDCVAHGDLDSDKVKRTIGDYLKIIPQDVGRARNWHKTLFASSDSVRKQNDLLDSLDASVQQVMSTPTNKKQAKKTEVVFNVALDLVTDGKILDQVKRKYSSSKGSHYDVATLDVKRIFKVAISTVKDAFEKHGKKVGNVKQLWHGTKASNLLSILKGGLVIPPASSSHCTGRYFADGLYFSDQSTKSIRYATNAWGYGGRTDRTFMFLCEVAMGREYIPSGGFSRLPGGYDSCFAKAGQSGVANNEMIVYSVNQANLIYLIEFTPHGR